MSHFCPPARCGEEVPDDQLMCRTHWCMVPKPLQRAVYSAWAGGTGAGSKAHTAAIQAAIKAV